MALPLRLRISHIDKQTSGVWSFRMQPVGGVAEPFVAGQVAVLEIEGDGRSYLAFAGAPEDPGYEFLVKRNTAIPFTRTLFDDDRAPEELPLVLREIVGRGFPVENYAGHDLVLVAMGTGLAPLRSTLRHLLRQRGDYGRLIVLYGARTAADFCYQEEMTAEWLERGVEVRQVISQPTGDDWSGPTGYVQSLLDNLVPTLANPLALVCGSLEMIEQTRERLIELGFDRAKILTNY